MKITKMQPIKVESQEALERVEKATKQQEMGGGSPRTFDPNFPLFRFETNNKHLIYVPNFFDEDEDGNKTLRMEAAYVHPVQKGRQFMQLRSTQGMAGLEEYGISGESPLNDAVQAGWELYNLKYKQVAESMGIDPSNDPGEVLKPKRLELLNQRTVKDADLRYYFPIVVFETEKDSKTGVSNFKYVYEEVDGVKMPKYEIMWMDVSESQWQDKWIKTMDSLDDGDSIAGKKLSLNYNFTNDLSNEKNPRRDSGKALAINIRQTAENEVEFFKYLDEQAKEWTPAKARETIIACALLTDEQQQEIVDDVMQDTYMELNALKSMQVGGQQQIQGGNQQATPDQQLANFGGVAGEGDGGDANEGDGSEGENKGLSFGS